MSSQQDHHIVIVGGNFGGINVAHYLLRKTFASLKTLQPQTTFHVTLVSPNTHFYYKIAAPRALINSTLIPEDQYFRSIADAFKQYDASIFEHVQGKATSLDPQNRTVTVQLNSGAEPKAIKYDSLVIASGTTSSSPLWTINDSHEASRAAIHALHKQLPNASTVLIAGAGPVGVETAGEIASAYPNAKVTLTSASDRVLPKQSADLSARAKLALEKLGVVLKTNTGLADPMASEDARPVKLSDGSSDSPDVFINATGARKMNTEWLPSDWLMQDRKVATRDAYFRVKGDGYSVQGVYVIGDVAQGAHASAIELDAMVPVVASSIAVDITGSSGASDGLMGWFTSFVKTPAPRQTEYKPMNAIVVPIGPKGGVGNVFGWNMPSFMVKKGKSEKYLMELVEPLITVKKWA
jgi:NADH dehydrogenase FAD-containing subunit